MKETLDRLEGSNKMQMLFDLQWPNQTELLSLNEHCKCVKKCFGEQYQIVAKSTNKLIETMRCKFLSQAADQEDNGKIWKAIKLRKML